MEGSGAEFVEGLPVAGVISIGAGLWAERPLLSELCACSWGTERASMPRAATTLNALRRSECMTRASSLTAMAEAPPDVAEFNICKTGCIATGVSPAGLFVLLLVFGMHWDFHTKSQ